MLLKKKIFFIVSSLRAGGSERVFWLLSQGFNKEIYDVTIVLMNSKNPCFSMDLNPVKIVDLKTIKASLSFFKLYKLIKKERPYAIFSTSVHINILLSALSFFLSIPYMIARESCIPDEMVNFGGRKDRFWDRFTRFFYQNFDAIVCQSAEMKHSLLKEYKIDPGKLIVIPNPIVYTEDIKINPAYRLEKRLIVVARLAREKGFDRLLNIFKELPPNYCLTIAGEGPLREQITDQIKRLNLGDRVDLLGQVSNITNLIAKHDVLVLSSYTEGFPNVALEALSVGIPVVAFRVGGITDLIKKDFNGFIVEQGDLTDFKLQMIAACSKTWDAVAIKKDAFNRFALDKVVEVYESLIGPPSP